MNELESIGARRSQTPGILGGAVGAVLLLALVVGGSLLTVSCRGHFRGHGPEAMREHMKDSADWLLHRVDATDQQKDEVQAVLDRAVNDLLEIPAAHRALHAALVSELTATRVDREALERLRREQIEQVDAVSRRIVEAIGEVADTLTQEQRLELADMSAGFRRHRWHR